MGSCQGLLVRLYNPKRVKSEVMQRGGRREENEGKLEAERAAGWAGLWVERCETSRGLCTYIILISAAKSNVSNVGVLTITSITGGSTAALFQPPCIGLFINFESMKGK